MCNLSVRGPESVHILLFLFSFAIQQNTYYDFIALISFYSIVCILNIFF